MMLGERRYAGTAVHVPPWTFAGDDMTSFQAVNGVGGGLDEYSLQALQQYLPSNADDAVLEFQVPDSDTGGSGDVVPVDAHTCDHFRMFEFKVRKCTRGRSHDWTECPYAHPGEKARRRDPRKFHYAGAACPDFRKGSCRKGDACEFAHGVFECWLHPARYRTQPCKDGMSCRRRVCFFAHSPDQLRVLSPRSVSDSYDGGGSPRRAFFMSSPEPVSPTTESPPMSPSVNEMVASLRQLHLNKLKPTISSSLLGAGGCPSSPRLNMAVPKEYFSLPTTPRPGIGYFEQQQGEEEPMERVESGRDLRARMFEKLSKENPLDRVDADPNPNPDLGWISELVK